jgi:hypothetical protein
MSSNDKDKAIHTAASVQRSRQGVTATGGKTQLNNPNRPSTRAFEKRQFLFMPTLMRSPPPHTVKKPTSAFEHPGTVVGANDKATPNLMRLKCPPEVETRMNSTSEVNQKQSQLKEPPVFETWEHGTPDAALTLSWLKEAQEIDKLQHATASSITSQLKDDDNYNSCVDWAVAVASAGGNAGYDSDIDVDFEPIAVDGMKKPAAKGTNDNVYEDNELFQDDTLEDNAKDELEYYHLESTGRWGHSLLSGGPPRPDTSGMSAAKAMEAIKEWRVLCKAYTDKVQREQRTLFGSNAANEIKYSSVSDAGLWLMMDVEVTPLL